MSVGVAAHNDELAAKLKTRKTRVDLRMVFSFACHAKQRFLGIS
jgi:hypothetical protein